jgi:hypothetical protein
MVTLGAKQPQLLTANAGFATTIYEGGPYLLGGYPTTARGGTSPYSYLWYPATDLSDVTSANPISTPTATISYKVEVTDTNGCTATDSVRITVTTTKAISNSTTVDHVNQENIAIYPNPTADNIVIELPASENTYSITLLYPDGRLLLNKQEISNKTPGKHEIILRTSVSGIYLLIIKNGNNQWTKKIVKK